MNRSWRLMFLCLLLVIQGCGGVSAVYGIPKPQWQAMSEAEKQAAKQRFEEQEAIYTQTRAAAEQAKKQAEQNQVEIEAQCRDLTRDDPNWENCQRRARILYPPLGTE